MSALKIGVCLRSLGLPLKPALVQCQKLGVLGVELDAAGELSPRHLSETGRRELKHLLRSHNLELASLGCPLRHGLDAADNQEGRIDHVRQVMTLAFDLGPRQVMVHAGKIIEDEQDPRRLRLNEGLTALAGHGDRIGVTLALAGGVDSPDLLEKCLAHFDSGSLAVDHDPAGLLMNGHDPFGAATLLARRIVSVRIRDARTAMSGRTVQEVPLGHGDLDWMRVLASLEEIGYRGWGVIERNGGTNPGGEIAAGVGLLRRIGGG
jgi:L-ribulose-5-phosphate 3-epimerase